MEMKGKSFEERLIKAVQPHNCLYEKSLRSYRNKVLAWRKVASVVGAGVKQCQDRWRSLRDRYVKEVAKMAKSDSVADENRRWMYFKQLSFLKDHVGPRRKISNSQCSFEETADTICSPERPLKLELDCSPEPPECFRLNGPSCSANTRSRSRCSADTPLASSRGFEETNEKLNKIMDTVSDLISTEVKRSRNMEFYVVLDGYLSKLPDEEQDSLKIELLNLVYGKTQKYK